MLHYCTLSPSTRLGTARSTCFKAKMDLLQELSTTKRWNKQEAETSEANKGPTSRGLQITILPIPEAYGLAIFRKVCSLDLFSDFEAELEPAKMSQCRCSLCASNIDDTQKTINFNPNSTTLLNIPPFLGCGVVFTVRI